MLGNDCAEEDHEARTNDQVQLAPEQHYDDAAVRGDHNDKDDDHNCMNWNDDEDVGEQSEGGHGDEGSQDGDGYLVDAADMVVEFSAELDFDVHHYFVTSDAADPKFIEQVGDWILLWMSLHQSPNF